MVTALPARYKELALVQSMLVQWQAFYAETDRGIVEV